MIKAIETKWKGYRFRSRTEARWAVFLEAAGIGFEYESEGVALPSGPYLPDFQLTDFPLRDIREEVPRERAWLEIKGAEPTDAEREKCAELAIYSDCPVLLAVGAPDFRVQILVFEPRMEGPVPPPEMSDLMALVIGELAFANAYGPEIDVLCLARAARDEATDADGDEVFREVYNRFNGPYCRLLGLVDGRVYDGAVAIGLGDKLKAAYDKARSARFEFGQADSRWSGA